MNTSPGIYWTWNIHVLTSCTLFAENGSGKYCKADSVCMKVIRSRYSLIVEIVSLDSVALIFFFPSAGLY